MVTPDTSAENEEVSVTNLDDVELSNTVPGSNFLVSGADLSQGWSPALLKPLLIKVGLARQFSVA